MIRLATVGDSTQLCDIYNHYILETTITFEEQVVTAADMAQRIQDTLQGLPWLVWDDGTQVLGFCYASKWKGRCAYRYSVESTVYVRPEATRQGIGSQLYRALLDDLRKRKLHTVIGGIALPNASSVALHEKFGFEKVAQFKQVGNKFDEWIDVGYWQLLLAKS
jgi:L-amino acid N-acyltransferase YncA